MTGDIKINKKIHNSNKCQILIQYVSYDRLQIHMPWTTYVTFNVLNIIEHGNAVLFLKILILLIILKNLQLKSS